MMRLVCPLPELTTACQPSFTARRRQGAARADRSSGYGMTTADRFLARVDRELAIIRLPATLSSAS